MPSAWFVGRYHALSGSSTSNPDTGHTKPDIASARSHELSQDHSSLDSAAHSERIYVVGGATFYQKQITTAVDSVLTVNRADFQKSKLMSYLEESLAKIQQM